MKYKKILLFFLIMMSINVSSINAINKDMVLINKNNSIKEISVLAISSNQTTNCNKEAIFGSKSDPNSISYLINEILQYPRYIVPALVIVFTTIDLFKAVMAGKEDEMKKAQSTAIKRVIAAVAIFLVPIMINIIMYLADIAWQGLDYTCH